MDGAGWFNVFWRACLEVVSTSLGRKGTLHRDRSSTTIKSARVSNGPVGSATIALATPTCFALLHTPSPPPPGPLNRTPRAAGTRLANTFATEAHQGLLEPRSKGLEGCTVINAMHGEGVREHSPMFDLEAGGEL